MLEDQYRPTIQDVVGLGIDLMVGGGGGGEWGDDL